ncbi:histidine kinase dimerization/phosphoacceptor domain-containing protein [Nonomuraea dietziae]|uniref:sensor histidine kinase n=1 Tax=Nonomuraea dietziae TaxID=65515 RepID=UPI0031DCD4AE
MSDLPQIARLKERFRALPPLQVDLALTAFVLLIQLWPFVGDNHDGKPWHWWGYVVVITAVLPLVWRRRAPVTSMAVSMLALSLYDLAETVPAQPIWYGSLISMYTVAAYTPRWPRLAVLAITIGGGLLLVGSSETAVRGTVGAVAAYAIGRATATSRAYAAALEERAVRLERERVLEAERAAELERARIARDMHDILAHAVSLMVVQAEAGPVVVRSDPGRAEAAFDAIAAAGRDAMVQLRRMLGALKEEEGPRALPSRRSPTFPHWPPSCRCPSRSRRTASSGRCRPTSRWRSTASRRSRSPTSSSTRERRGPNSSCGGSRTRCCSTSPTTARAPGSGCPRAATASSASASAPPPAVAPRARAPAPTALASTCRCDSLSPPSKNPLPPQDQRPSDRPSGRRLPTLSRRADEHHRGGRR